VCPGSKWDAPLSTLGRPVDLGLGETVSSDERKPPTSGGAATLDPRGEPTEAHGFVRARCTSCDDDDVWLSCNSCGASDRFEVGDEGVRCWCGAGYDHATCVCGAQVPRERLVWVPFDEGPPGLTEWELDPLRVALLVLGLVAVVAIALVLWLS